jgi:hypothetical protein
MEGWGSLYTISNGVSVTDGIYSPIMQERARVRGLSEHTYLG